ncbi:MAG: hypothetical protein KF802_08650 [Bdellovibrionaceae bacterium]|nr:hypothetical protein [Pseudobdellovibrionaceae bacterium]MBX3034117.1 hypothetical protein [Pseudobdellovibrionaceae bacterium]
MIIFSLAGVLALVTVLAVIPPLRARIRAFFLPETRQILAKTSGYITPRGPFVSVFKISEGGSLMLEIYTTPDDQGNPQLLQKIPLNEIRDGYVNFQGNATNLALSDTDHDGALDILAPTFDEQMTPRLNVFRYNEDLRTFERASAPPASSGH